MALKVRVAWPNAGSPLLPESGATVLVFANGRLVVPSASKVGERTYDLPEGTVDVKLSARFRASFGAVSGIAPQGVKLSADAMDREVLHVEQSYTVAGEALTAVSLPEYAGPHPLVVTKGAANVHGVAVITLRTLFVDVSPFWEQYCQNWDYYLRERTKGMTTHVLGFTGGAPLVWLANVPDAMASFGADNPGCLVFYRPASYAYGRLDQPHQASAIARYLCKPKPVTDGAAAFFEVDRADTDGYHLVRCGFEAAILDSRRALVMLHPWPSGSSFGAAETSAMSELAEAAMRLLWAKSVVCKGVANVHVGSLGIAGFSRGGVGHWNALRGNMARIREVYGFDCNATPQAAPSIIQWFNSHVSNKLRLVNGAYNFDAHAAIAKTVSPNGSRPDVTVIPPTAASFAPGGNAVFDHFVEMAPHLRGDVDTRHQFAICGGKMLAAEGTPYDLDLVETWLLGFLRASDFPML